jgi:hypothetical protein
MDSQPLTPYEGVEYTHRVLWTIVEDQVRLVRERERDWFGPALVAKVFAFHAVEAYINYVGEQIAPAVWADERNFFRKEPYRGWEGKVRYVLELVKIPWTPQERPLSTLMKLKELRDAIGHGKSERFSGTRIDSGMPWLPTSKIRAMVTPKQTLDDVLTDVQALLGRIHVEVAPTVNDPFFKAATLRGPSLWISGG